MTPTPPDTTKAHGGYCCVCDKYSTYLLDGEDICKRCKKRTEKQNR